MAGEPGSDGEMSASNVPPDAAENARAVLDRWAEGLAEVLASMADQRPAVSWEAAARAPAGDTDLLWWEQPFGTTPALTFWVGAPRATWEHIGTLTLRAAGLETVETAEARNTWSEILSQSLGVMARSIGSAVGSEVTCGPGLERAPGEGERDWYSVTLAFPDTPLPPLLAAASPRLTAVFSGQRQQEGNGVPGGPEPPAPDSFRNVPERSRTLDLLLEVDLPVSISFGKTQLPMKDVLKLTTGSIIELNRGVEEPVEVLVNHCLIARGEVVVVEGNYGVRIQEIASRQDRLRSLR
jgi:flagellar motor switch protein FliN